MNKLFADISLLVNKMFKLICMGSDFCLIETVNLLHANSQLFMQIDYKHDCRDLRHMLDYCCLRLHLLGLYRNGRLVLLILLIFVQNSFKQARLLK